jgi:hypothetical protein
MSSDLIKRVQEAVARGVRARSRFYASIDLEDEQSLGPPASLQDIEKLEKKCGNALPPSYRTFLVLHDGWIMVDGGCDLLRAGEMISGPVAEKTRKWQASMVKEGQAALASGLVVGFSAISQKRIVLDFGQLDAAGEGRLIQWDSDEFSEYESFIKWLEDTAQEFEELAESPNNSGDE